MAFSGVMPVVVVLFMLITNVESGLVCLDGVDVPDLRDVTTIQRCGPHEVCSLEQYINPLGFIRHKTGCKDKLYCGGIGHSSGINTFICSECCNTDLCAVQLCGNTGYPSTSGPICYHCPYPVESPLGCGTIQTCSRDEVCGVNVIDSGKYEIKCRTQPVCNQIANTANCSICCAAQLCNNDCGPHEGIESPTATATTTGTTSPIPTATTTGTTSPISTATTTACSDDSMCPSLIQTFLIGGRDLCSEQSVKYFCSATCNVCPSTATALTGQTTPTTQCVDTIPNCEAYGKYYCSRPEYTRWVGMHCRYYCQACSQSELSRLDSITTTIQPSSVSTS